MTVPSGLMISAPSSGAGKTTVTLGLLRALADDGLAVQAFKSGPDYIDPAFHRAASRRDSFNLDTWAMGPELLAAVIDAAVGDRVDLGLAEGAMGLFDGVEVPGRAGHGTAAETAELLGWPVVLVVDAWAQAQSAGASALGFAAYRPQLPVAGVIVNRVASPKHERLVRAGLERAGLPVLGVLPRRPDLTLPERHLGLVQALEHPDVAGAIAACAQLMREHVDLDAVREAARSSSPALRHTGASGGAGVDADSDTLSARGTTSASAFPPPPGARIALARDEAFSFTYPHLLEGWRRAGAELLPFSPLADEAPDPQADVVWLPGGYPELHAGRLAAAARFRDGLREHARTRPVHGECGGYMVLGEALIDADGVEHRMTGLLGLVSSYEKRKLHLGYRAATLLGPIPGYAAGAELRGHEFHYCRVVESPDPPLADVVDADGGDVADRGSRRGHVTGSFFHLISGA